MTEQRKMHLGLAFNLFGTDQSSWRHPDVPAGDMTDIALHLHIAKKAEEGLFDFVFAGDSLTALWPNEAPEDLGRQAPYRALDPLILMSALALVTNKLGLAVTINTTYGLPPYTAARMLASLDHLSRGRACWNLVTGQSPMEAPNFTAAPHPSPEERYARGAEFAQVLFGLWDSWDDDAIICDKANLRYYDPLKMHILDHHGEYFDVKGPLTTPRSPQGRPVTVQAGSSHAGRELAAEVADVAFCVATSLPEAKAFYDDIKGRAARFGRSRDSIRVLPGVQVHVGETDEEAQAKLAVMENCSDVRLALKRLNMLFEGDLSALPLDEPFPDVSPLPGVGSRAQTMKDLAKEKNYTLRKLAIKFTSFGHWILAGSPKTICDTLEEFFHGGAADGFIVQPPHNPHALDAFVDLVVPELQRRGLFRTRYEGMTLRDHLGLPRHVSKSSRVEEDLVG